MDTTTPLSDKQTLNTANKILASENPLEFIKKAEIDFVKIYKNLYRISLNAKIVAKDRDGDAIELGDDNKAQTSASLVLLELAKHIKDKSVSTQIAFINDSKILENYNRIKNLRE